MRNGLRCDGSMCDIAFCEVLDDSARQLQRFNSTVDELRMK